MGGSYEDQKKRRKLGAEAELIDTLGTENEKEGVKAVKEYGKEQELIAKNKEDKVLEMIMGAKRGDKFSYNKFLASLMERRMQYAELPANWSFDVTPDKEGVVLELTSPHRRFYRTAFRSTGEAVYDLNAIETFGRRAESTVDNYGKKKETDKIDG